ncbi:MAG: alcohol dehydrogenase catalytic domain-containing protein [Candidatus Omnitrophica bacterium]|nr:alcohol dehydrogenase catalytic domain-containing protein [Candidatus Omnitrophota bacterium]
MRVANYYNNHDLRIEERPMPKIGPGELLIRVEASGICGSDVMEWYRLHKAPLILGHEVAGVVEDTGKDLNGYKKGMRVTLAHHVPCGLCHYCLSGHEAVCETLRKTNFDPGGFCEYLRLPRVNIEKGGVFILPEEVGFDEATLVEPLACVLRGQRIAGFKKGHSVLVIGSGIAGLLHILLARAHGAGVIVSTDIIEYRLKAALKFGADASIDAGEYKPDKLRSLNHGMLADLVIVTSGADSAIHQALGSVGLGGTILFFAPSSLNAKILISYNDLFWRNEITLTSSYAANPGEYQEALELISSKKVNVAPMITHRMGLAKISEGFRLVEEAGESIKVIIHPQL